MNITKLSVTNKMVWLMTNNQLLFDTAVAFMKQYRGRKPYKHFLQVCVKDYKNARTPLGFGFYDHRIDKKSMDEFMYELKEFDA